MKVIICNKIKENDKLYFKRAWRIPFQELENIGWISIDQNEISTKKISDFFMEKYNVLPQVLLFWNTNTFISNNITDILNNKWIKCIYMDDLHQKTKSIQNYRNLIINNFDYIFCTCAYIFTKFYKIPNPNKLIWYPHNVNNNFTVIFNKTPINKILLSGCLDKTVYPFRYHMHTMSHKYPIDILPQLSYQVANHNNYGHNYIKHINKYIAAFACCSNKNTPYIVSKFFEIPAAGALLVAYDEFVKEPLKELGFIDGENYISVTYQNLEKKISFITDPTQRDVVDKIRRKGYELVWGKHTLQNRVQLIENTTNKN